MAFPRKSQPSFYVLNLFGILHFLIFFPSISNGSPSQYTTHLISYDSPLSPFYEPSSTHFDHLRNAFQRSFKRIHHFKSSLVPSGGDYLIKIFIGTPPVEMIGIVDTGSDLIWTQCLPCIQCYNQTIPLFNPQHSSSYHSVSCKSKFCNALENSDCGHNTNTCRYNYSYADGSNTAGNLASETLTLGSTNPISIPKIVFGCAKNTEGKFDASESGIIGLNARKLSLISQLGSKKFSYCLVPSHINSTSRISFGKDSVVPGPDVVTTPIVRKKPINLYRLTLKAFSVGNERIPFTKKGENKTSCKSIKGNIIIDSGTKLNVLPMDVYDGLVSALDKVISAKKVKDPNGFFPLCYKKLLGKIGVPIITAHFKGGDVQLQPVNTFSLVKEDVLCFTTIPNLFIFGSDFSVFGNLAQTNFVVGYDLHARTVSFKPTDCTKQP